MEMYFKLSLNNMKKSFKDYAIYFMTLIFGVCVFYTFNSIEAQGAMLKLSESKNTMVQNLVNMMGPISVFVSLILAYLIVYANNFLIRRRKKEFGLYQTLGMGKWKIAQILFFETLIVGVLSLGIGLMIGIFASQGVSVIIAHIFEADLSHYTFVFSKNACYKTGLYFTLIYLLAMLFNIVTVSRYKLVDLLTAGKKNETLKVRNPYVTMILFILSLGLIGYAYYLLKVGDALLMADGYRSFITMLVCGAVGTYLLFASLAGFLLRVVQMNKKLYLKNLNMFVLRQFNSRINSTTVSLTMISLMLLLTIGIMSAALSMVSVFNRDLTSNNLTDISFVYYDKPLMPQDEKHSILQGLEQDGFPYEKYFSSYINYDLYNVEKDTTTLTYLIGKENINEIKAQYGSAVNFADDYLPTMLESEYNQLMALYGNETEQVDLQPNEYMVVANFPTMVQYIDQALAKGNTLDYSSGALVPKYDKCIDMPLSNTNTDSELGTVIIDDSVFNENFKQYANFLCSNYRIENQTTEQAESQFMSVLDTYYKDHEHTPYEYTFSKLQMEASSVGITAIAVFVGLYLGIIFSITSAAILAIGQLSQASDNKMRYSILRKIGVDERMINLSVFLQIAMYFMFPLVVAMIHSVVGLSEVNKLITLFGNMNIAKNIFFTAIFIILIYGSYFLATYLGSKGIIKEKDRNQE